MLGIRQPGIFMEPAPWHQKRPSNKQNYAASILSLEINPNSSAILSFFLVYCSYVPDDRRWKWKEWATTYKTASRYNVVWQYLSNIPSNELCVQSAHVLYTLEPRDTKKKDHTREYNRNQWMLDKHHTILTLWLMPSVHLRNYKERRPNQFAL
jgi:hypothetical protein